VLAEQVNNWPEAAVDNMRILLLRNRGESEVAMEGSIEIKFACFHLRLSPEQVLQGTKSESAPYICFSRILLAACECQISFNELS